MGIFQTKALGGPTRTMDLEQARRALTLLVDPEHGVQLQTLPSAAWRQRKGSDIDTLLSDLKDLSEGKGVYWTLNPINLDLFRAARATDVVKRRWFMVDADRSHVVGQEECSASDEERDRLLGLFQKVMDHLGELGWPAPVLIDSGNGFHALYRVDLPNTDHVRVLFKECLRKLAEQFTGDGIEIDRGVYDAKRSSKVPGTWACKGQNTPERPHRMVRLLYVPHQIEMVPVELFKELSGVVEQPPRPVKSSLVSRARNYRNGQQAYVQRAVDLECGKVASARVGERNNQLFKSAAALGEFVGACLIGREVIEDKLYVAACHCGLDRDQDGERAIRQTIQSGINKGAESPREIPDKSPEYLAARDRLMANGQISGKPEENGQHAEADEPIVIQWASDVEPKLIEWLWPGRIPLGKLTTFAGQGGLGKTFVLCDLAARLSRGLEWPDRAGECAQVGKTFFVSGEDDLNDTLVPRLIELGADLKKIAFPTGPALAEFSMADVETQILNMAAKQMDGMKLVVIDPPTSFMDGVDDHKNVELRRVLTVLQSWAAKNRVAVIFNTHFNKSSGSNIDAASKVIGGVAWVAGVRAAHAFARDEDDPEKVLFCPIKLNVGKMPKGLAYRLVAVGPHAKVEWLGEIDQTADEAVSKEPAKRKKRAVEAVEWLEELFANVTEVPAPEVFKRAARETTLSRSAIYEAKDELGIKSTRAHDPDNGTWSNWVWPQSRREEWAAKKVRSRQDEATF